MSDSVYQSSSESPEAKRSKVQGDLSDSESKPCTSNSHYIESIEGWVILITGVHMEATTMDLKDRLADYGFVRSLQLPLDRRTGYVKGYAIAEFNEESEAKEAIEKLNGSEFMGQTLSADWAFVDTKN